MLIRYCYEFNLICLSLFPAQASPPVRAAENTCQDIQSVSCSVTVERSLVPPRCYEVVDFASAALSP